MALRPYRLATTLVRNKLVQSQIRRFSKYDVNGNSPIPSNKQRFVPTSGTYPRGFLLGSTNVGIKPAGKFEPDLILVASEYSSCGAVVFPKTTRYPAASVTSSKDTVGKTKGRGIRGVIAHSGGTADYTDEDTARMSREAGNFISGEIGEEGGSSVLVMVRGFEVYIVSS